MARRGLDSRPQLLVLAGPQGCLLSVCELNITRVATGAEPLLKAWA